MPADSDGAILAVTNGWINPLPRFMHCETLQVFTRNQAGKGEGAIPGGLLGLGVFVGVATFAYAISQGCKRAEILAINDSGALHPLPWTCPRTCGSPVALSFSCTTRSGPAVEWQVSSHSPVQRVQLVAPLQRPPFCCVQSRRREALPRKRARAAFRHGPVPD